MTTDTDPIEHYVTQVLNSLLLQTSSAPPVIPETPEEMAAEHDHQVRSLIEVSGVPPDVAEALLNHMQPHRPDLDSCQQWVDDLTALDQCLCPVSTEQLREGDDDVPSTSLLPTVGDLAMWVSDGGLPCHSPGAHSLPH